MNLWEVKRVDDQNSPRLLCDIHTIWSRSVSTGNGHPLFVPRFVTIWSLLLLDCHNLWQGDFVLRTVSPYMHCIYIYYMYYRSAAIRVFEVTNGVQSTILFKWQGVSYAYKHLFCNVGYRLLTRGCYRCENRDLRLGSLGCLDRSFHHRRLAAALFHLRNCYFRHHHRHLLDAGARNEPGHLKNRRGKGRPDLGVRSSPDQQSTKMNE